MATQPPRKPIDDEALTARVVAAHARERQLLASARLPAQPGACLLLVGPSSRGDPDPLGPLVRGVRPIYAGSAANLAGRIRRYRSPSSLLGAEGFPFDRLWIATLPTRTWAGARLCEAASIEVRRPVFSAPELAGLGSRSPGQSRVAAQRPAPFDRGYRRP